MERFTFTNLAELREWLHMFTSRELECVLPNNADQFVLDWHTETLSDGSEVHNATITNA